jgi:2-polyprenyl-6-methoxyphenol hydroxylase-like FAD-dependent oxidoreductase
MPVAATAVSAARRAVVLGASLAGLLAARVLSERFAEVVLIERDRLPDGAAPRKGTPHAVHPHGLLARGREVIEQLFPGFTQALLAQGALAGDMQRDVAFDAGGLRLAEGDSALLGLAASRLAIEAEIRRRVRALPGVRFIEEAEALAPQLDERRQTVVAARWTPRDASAAFNNPASEQTLPCALVVDCSGRASRLPGWLQGWGYEAVAEETVEIGIAYVSAYFRREGALAHGAGIRKVALIGGVTATQPRPAVMLAQEPDADGTPRWVVGVGGYAGDHPAPTLDGMRERAREIGSPEVLTLAREGTPLGPVQRYHMPRSLRRRYERLPRWPQGLLVMGDALASFNPIYGQGMTVAACEALALRDALARTAGPAAAPQTGPLARRFLRAAARIVDTPWQLAVGGDLTLPCVPGPRPLAVRIVNAYVARLQRVAARDPLVARAFLEVVNLIKPPPALFAPRVLWRVMTARGTAAAPVVQRALQTP